ncbi:MAG: hypothetical protein KTR20_10890 [Cellvibrionaceae bacterium]|nr:hypothetical protein [Cellvibrionaceae bacterium]
MTAIQGLPSSAFLATLLLCALGLSACAGSTETSNFQGETSDISIDDVFSSEDQTDPTGPVTAPAAATLAGEFPGIDSQSFKDYHAFTTWLRARQPNNPEFYEFQLWREYLEYIRISDLD